MSEDLDDIDREILYALQQDARNNSNADISEQVGVSPSTVGKRITRLEERGVILGYRPKIDYELAGLPLEVLFICTVPIAERESLVESAHKIDGVVNVREMMTGRKNVHIRVVGASNDEITRIATTIDNRGYDITDEILLRSERDSPASVFLESTLDE
ncbi:Lrp/AsnC family transcriptional regulator [Halostagnicola sp. A-GB9-2]|uniref:Lrp/AsnC family transcriptional regulator n=1 Tax=Halostagnicola sp. A-GB9-2 TaxID=3048066 RepID=UPI0024BF7170|nr:Lrp/AsnC family transcriptional regulator [Halostagnicola sp. A-GB9-2]MDJ1431013.1 Lrp/AsnC family transcriptional regulator [Halostagnicola sp. A-GB9-2]